MSSWKDLYSEVKQRKMEALNKKDVVHAVEKHGKILAVEGRYEKPKKIIDHMYAATRETIKPKQIMKYNLSDYDVVLIGCPGDEIPHSAYPKVKDYVSINGGWLITTDWAIKTLVEVVFPGYIRWNGQKTGDAVVACQIMEPNHPYLDGVLSEIQQNKWQKKDAKNTKKTEFKWWLETKSFPISILSPNVHVLISSQEILRKWGESPVFVYFDFGKAGGRVIHMISHTHLQKGGAKGKYASALILTNILDEKVAQKTGISKTPSPSYVSNWEDAQHPQQQYSAPIQQNDYLTPTDNVIGLTGTSQIVQVNVNSSEFSFASKCGYCGYDFGEYTGKIFMCNACKTPYHETCLNMQINEGVCKNCNKILLW